MRKSMKSRIAERFKQRQIDRQEKDRIRYSREYQLEVEGYIPERR